MGAMQRPKYVNYQNRHAKVCTKKFGILIDSVSVNIAPNIILCLRQKKKNKTKRMQKKNPSLSV